MLTINEYINSTDTNTHIWVFLKQLIYLIISKANILYMNYYKNHFSTTSSKSFILDTVSFSTAYVFIFNFKLQKNFNRINEKTDETNNNVLH